MATSSLVNMGKIVSAFGIQGWVKIKTSSDLNNLKHYKNLHVLINNIDRLLAVEKFSIKNDALLVLFAGINSRNDAETLVGATIAIDRNDFPETAEDEYYWVDLIGLKVINQQSEPLGVVEDLMDTGANSVLVVKDKDKTRLIPFVAVYIINVDMQNKQIIVDWGVDY